MSPEFRDLGLSPSTAYTYRLFAADYHQNYSYADLNVTTAPAGAVSPRQIGLRSTTAHWGAEGEQIDMRSGNLHFTLPLVKAQGRGGSSAAFVLNYNSQQWMHHSGRTWKFGKDTGFGFGWKFGLGSLTPVWSGAWALNSVVFTDASRFAVCELQLANRVGGGCAGGPVGTRQDQLQPQVHQLAFDRDHEPHQLRRRK